ncbi:MAG: exodeoxyribonuclease VII large subunit [Acidobacteria bacterium]|nr:exodeoxyribonuclease VII large subunit [Acidobacteriota bacterium]
MSDLFALPFDDDTPHEPQAPWSVSELTAAIRGALEGAFASVAVEGEISNCRQWSSGHLYFTLKDDRAQLRAVMFRTTVRTLKFKPEDGMRVVARGRLGVYDAKGEYQLICDALDPHGLGARQAAFEALKRQLQAEGLFDQARKRPLPTLPRRIGVVTSLDGAAVRDIVRVLVTRHPTARILVRAARVQGDGAADDLIRALRAIGRAPDVDVIIIGRGGGSAEDLWAFNDERLARAIAASPVPVISAVGHEVDFTIADFVADVRAATPSNAAELVVDRADNFLSRIDRADRRLRASLALGLARRAQRVQHAQGRLRHWPTILMLRDRDVHQVRRRLDRAIAGRLASDLQRFDRLRRRLEARDLRRVAGVLATRLAQARGRLDAAMTRRRLVAAARAATLSGRLDALSPLSVLARGYAVCWNEARDSIIRSSAAVGPGDAVQVTLAEGELACRVERVRPDRSQ